MTQNVHYRARLLEAIEAAIQNPPDGLEIIIESSKTLGSDEDFINIYSAGETVDDIIDDDRTASQVVTHPDGTRTVVDTCCNNCHYEVTETFNIEVYLKYCDSFYLKDAKFAHFILSRMAQTPFDYVGSDRSNTIDRNEILDTVRIFTYSYTYRFDINSPEQEIKEK